MPMNASLALLILFSVDALVMNDGYHCSSYTCSLFHKPYIVPSGLSIMVGVPRTCMEDMQKLAQVFIKS